ncbi:hypothetical protein IOD13_18910 [Brevibacterium casei]|nr:hypothetical protein [Brevibacterium casei]
MRVATKQRVSSTACRPFGGRLVDRLVDGSAATSSTARRLPRRPPSINARPVALDQRGGRKSMLPRSRSLSINARPEFRVLGDEEFGPRVDRG